MNKAPSWATGLEQAWTQVPDLQECDPSKLSHMAGYAPPDLVWRKLAELLKGSPKPPNTALA
jgi:hypothetical protein